MAMTQPSGTTSSSISHSLSETDPVGLLETISGSHLFKVTNYSLQKEIGIGVSIRSKIFVVGGYEWTIDCYPGGNGEENYAYIGAFLNLCNEVKDVKVMFSIILLDENGENFPEATYAATDVFSLGRMCLGWTKFIKKCELENSTCLIDDCFTIKCEVQVTKTPCNEELPEKLNYITIPPPNLHEHLGHLLECGKRADVTFIVNGESFHAHLNVLASRSSVFDAELFGSMREQSAQQIVIRDMESQVFKVLLHFMYTDMLPNIEDLIGQETQDKKERTIMLLQHLIVAANRYELERLRLLCEDKLCEFIEVSTLARILVLAYQHHCEQLKDVCLGLLDDCQTRLAVKATDGFKHLLESCAPLILKDIFEKL